MDYLIRKLTKLSAVLQSVPCCVSLYRTLSDDNEVLKGSIVRVAGLLFLFSAMIVVDETDHLIRHILTSYNN